MVSNRLYRHRRRAIRVGRGRAFYRQRRSEIGTRSRSRWNRLRRTALRTVNRRHRRTASRRYAKFRRNQLYWARRGLNRKLGRDVARYVSRFM